MKKEGTLKRILSVILSVVLVVSMITVTQPNQANAAEVSANILTNGGFDKVSEAWKDQGGALVGAQTVVDDVNTTIETEFTNDFAGNAPTWGWNMQGNTVDVVEVEGNKVLSFTYASGTSYITNYGFLGYSGFTVGNEYRISCRIYSDTAVSFRLYDDATGQNEHKMTSAKEWTTYTVNLTASATSTTLYFGFMDSYTGTVYIDDLKIEHITTIANKETVYIPSFTNDFAGNAPTWGWNMQGNTVDVVEVEGNKVLSFTYASGTSYITNYGFLGYSGFTVGNEYRISCRIYSDTAVSFRLYDDATGQNEHKMTSAKEWTTYTVNLTASATSTTLYFGFMDSYTGTVYIDDLIIAEKTEQTKKTYTEGIGTCNGAEADSVLAMKDYTKVTQGVAIKKGNRYAYSFMVKSENAGEDLAFGVTAGNNTTDPVTVTSDWKEVTGSFTATADATEFGFTRSGTGTVLIDDVVLKETVTGPADHTANGGAYIPAGHINTLKGDTWDFSSDVTGQYSGNATREIANKTLKISELTNNQYV